MESNVLDAPIAERLPKELQLAQDAILLPEIQEMMKKLAQYNLGVCMPHFHNEDNGDFELLKDGVVQMEHDLKVRFMTKADAEETNAIPVAWRWSGEGVSATAECIARCEIVETPGGKQFHADRHKGGGHPWP